MFVVVECDGRESHCGWNSFRCGVGEELACFLSFLLFCSVFFSIVLESFVGRGGSGELERSLSCPNPCYLHLLRRILHW